jgi:thiol-disulfide isomerase/thioredoxin
LTNTRSSKVFSWGKELAVLGVIILSITAWQARNLLDADGSVKLTEIRLVALEGGSTEPLTREGKRTLIYFFAPWCQVCALSIGNLEYLNPAEVNIVAVAMDYQSIEEVQDFVDQHQVLSHVLLGTQSLKDTFKLTGYPTYYLINEQKQVVASSIGYSSAIGLSLRTFFN